MHPIFQQTLFYGIVVLLAFFAIGAIQNGFFWKYLRVRMSFGKFILVKIRAVNRDHYAVGSIDEGFLVYKSNGEVKRISLEDSSGFYKSISVSWIDVDEKKNCVCKADYSVVDGFDAVKFNDLYVRCLYKPVISSSQEKIVLGLLIICVIGILVLGIVIYKLDARITGLQNIMAALKTATENAIIPANI